MADGSTTVLTIGPLADFAPDSARRVDVDGHRLAVVRLAGAGGGGADGGADQIFVIGDRCSHADYSLAEGEVDPGERTLECWKHGSTFSLETGEPTCLPAIKPVPSYAARVVDGTIMVEIAEGEEVAR